MSTEIDQQKLARMLGAEVVGTTKVDTLTGTVSVEAFPSEESTKKRSILSLQDRYKVADYLRQQLAPITADTNKEIAAKVSEATGVQISWGQLDYMINELPDLKLNDRVALTVKPSDPANVMLERIAEMQRQHSEALEHYEARNTALDGRIANVEAHAFNVDQNVISVGKSVSELADIVSKLTDRIIALEAKQS
jgi:hypothetical protein